MLQAIIFDMDGLMIDTEKVNFKFFGRFFSDIGFELTQEDYCLCFTGKTIKGALSSIREYRQLQFTDEDFQTYFENFKSEWESQIVPLKPGVIALIHDLKQMNKRIAIATSSDIKRVHRLLDRYNILSYFDAIVCGPDVQNGKPAPDIFLKACEKLQVHPDEALVLEDSETGIEAAHNANISVICVPDMKIPDKTHENMTIAILPTLYKVIEIIKMID